ncbi:hypothetical protein PoB_002870900 [Plakobranchus ocellatus]|uniref:Uncharacterized protein n=1 Tax=Plakobranchus ocellatus TaxID=259542 RepID=A0AAV4A7K2_9GAST|nr:hypothetical protein PoB_002870900 [Plakobranchus ocellatus]
MYSRILQTYKCRRKEWRSHIKSQLLCSNRPSPISTRDTNSQCYSPPPPISPTKDIEDQFSSPQPPQSPTRDIEGQCPTYKCSRKEWRSHMKSQLLWSNPPSPISTRDINSKCSSPPPPIPSTRDIKSQCSILPYPISSIRDIKC